MFGILARYSKSTKIAVFFALTYAFASCVWSIAGTGLWQHGPSLLFFNAGLLLLLYGKWGLSGLFYGLSVVNRPSNGIFLLAVLFYLWWVQRRGMIPFILCSIIPFIFLAIYSQVYWGTPFLAHSFYLNAVTGRSENTFWAWLVKVFAWLISPSRGLLSMSPIYVFSFLAIFDVLRSKNAEDVLWKNFAVAVLLYIPCYAAAKGIGGWTFGYRYMVELLPLLTVFLVRFWQTEKGYKIYQYFYLPLFVVFLVFSIFVQSIGAYVYPCGFNSSPVSITDSYYRVWDFGDSELSRCMAKIFVDKQ